MNSAALTYSLYNNNKENSLEFYQRLSDFTTEFIAGKSNESSIFTNDFIRYPVSDGKIKRNFQEAFLEFLMIGIFLQNYGNRTVKMKRLMLPLLRRLYKARRKFPFIKSFIDRLRGRIMYQSLSGVSYESHNPVRQFNSMLQWMEATNEFNEEIGKLKDWQQWLNSIAPIIAQYILNVTLTEASKFTKEAKNTLGSYTQNVNSFLVTQNSAYKNREDFLFTLRNENEYFLNLFGAEVLNRVLSEKYRKTKYKVIILPQCMRNGQASECLAEYDGKGKICKQCNVYCNIGRVARIVGKKNVKTYIVPHSSDFSKFLKEWSNQDHTGLIGVGCALNLLKGGFEMQRHTIPSQCVFLDYSGCKKHWNINGKDIPTNLNLEQLQVIV